MQIPSISKTVLEKNSWRRKLPDFKANKAVVIKVVWLSCRDSAMEQLDQRHRIDSRNRPKYIYIYIYRQEMFGRGSKAVH